VENLPPSVTLAKAYNALMRQIRPAAVAILTLTTVALGLVVIAFRSSGNFLVVDNREKSDAIVVTQADSIDPLYWLGLHLLTDGFGRELLVDARTDQIYFGRNQAEWTADFIRETATTHPGQVRVCPITADTTAQEVYEVGNCLKGHSIRSVLLVVRDFHSRRSLAIFSRLLPAYHWSIAAAPDSARFCGNWWRKRVWIRTALIEWQHMLWWEIVDQWRYAPGVGSLD
jgi:hypothetical protein